MKIQAKELKRSIDALLHPKYFWVFLAFLMLLISFISTVQKPYLRGITLWFPDSTTNMLKPELRFISNFSNKTDAVTKVIEELLLGPATPGYKPLNDAKARLLSVIPHKSRYYIIIEPTALFSHPSKAQMTDMNQFILAMKKALAFNASCRHFTVVIGGKIVFSQ